MTAKSVYRYVTVHGTAQFSGPIAAVGNNLLLQTSLLIKAAKLIYRVND